MVDVSVAPPPPAGLHAALLRPVGRHGGARVAAALRVPPDSAASDGIGPGLLGDLATLVDAHGLSEASSALRWLRGVPDAEPCGA